MSLEIFQTANLDQMGYVIIVQKVLNGTIVRQLVKVLLLNVQMIIGGIITLCLARLLFPNVQQGINGIMTPCLVN